MANAETSEKLRVARPTVALAGRDDVSLTQGLTRLQVNETTAGLFCCEAAFGNWGSVGGEVDYLYFDRGRLDFGKPIQIKIGSEVIFDGFVSGLEGCFPEGAGPEIVVLAEDRLQNLRMTRRTRAFEQITDADVFQRIARDHGLTSTVDVVGPMHKVLAQVNQSDLAFIRERARAIDSEVWVHDNSLHVQARGRRDGGSVILGYGNELREFTVLADLAHQRREIVVSAWDVTAKRDTHARVTSDVIRNEIGDGTSGASILAELRSVFGDAVEALEHTAAASAEEARHRAEAFFRQSARRFVVGRGVAEADPRLRVGNYVDLRGLGSLFSGSYYLSEVTIRFDGVLGVRTEFCAERPAIGAVR